MSWSKYHSRYYHHCTGTITGRRSAKFCETRPVLSWTHSASWCWSEFVSISLLCFHCWPKPHSSPHTLQNTGLIKDQFRDINLWGSTYLSPLTSHLTPQSWEDESWDDAGCGAAGCVRPSLCHRELESEAGPGDWLAACGPLEIQRGSEEEQSGGLRSSC